MPTAAAAAAARARAAGTSGRSGSAVLASAELEPDAVAEGVVRDAGLPAVLTDVVETLQVRDSGVFLSRRICVNEDARRNLGVEVTRGGLRGGSASCRPRG